MTDPYQSEQQSLLESLDLAFGSLEIPDEAKIVPDPSGRHLECAQVMRTFGGRKWQSFTIDELEFESDALYFLSPMGFRYYLPAFVRVTVQHLDRSDLIPVAIVSCLRPRSDPDFRALNRERLTILDAAQRKVLIDFCQFLPTRAEEVVPVDELQACQRELGRGLS
jgi:hypothetical protein